MDACLPPMSGNSVWIVDNRGSFCIDNGIMIAHAGLLAFRRGQVTPLYDSTCTQRYSLHPPLT
jgi:N6-L-threonylcarbamoyladenine synthase